MNRKRILSIILTMCIMFSMIPVADAAGPAAFVPGQEYANVQFDEDGNVIENKDEPNEVVLGGGKVFYDDLSDLSSAGILGVLDIMGAYTDSSFKPNVYISREEFLGALLKLIKAEPVMEEDYGVGIFYDVEKDDPYYSVVYTAAKMGILDDSYDDNSFRANSVITYYEAVTYTMRALGYTAIGGATSPLVQYLDRAKSIGLLKGLSVRNREALTRLEVAVLLANALNSPINNVFDDDDKTPLFLYYDIKKGEGIVEATAIEAISGDRASKRNIRIDGVTFRTDSDEFDALLGMKVYYWYNDDGIVYMSRHKNVEEEVFEDEQIVRFSPSSNTLTYEDDGRARNVKISDNAVILYNGKKPISTYNESIFNIKNGRIRLISNDRGGAYTLVLIEEYVDYVLRRAILEDRIVVLGVDNGLGSIRIDVDDTYIDLISAKGENTPVVTTDANGNEKIQLSGFGSDSAISVYAPWESVKDRNGDLPRSGFSYIKIVCSDKQVSGKVTNTDIVENRLWIDDTEYVVSGTNRFEGAQWSNIPFNGSAAFYVNAYGKLVAKAETESDWSYAFLIKPYFNDEDGIASMRICTSAGKVIKYDCINPLRVNGVRIKNDIKVNLALSAAYAGRGFKYSQVIRYKLNADDVISEIQTITSAFGTATGISTEEHLSRDAQGIYKFLNDGEGHIVDGSGAGDRIIARFFPPELTLEVSAVENDDPAKYRLVSYKTQLSDVDLDIYDVTDCTPSFAIRYVGGGSSSNEMLLTGSSATAATPVMYNESSIALNEDDEVVLKFTVAQQGTVKEYFSKDLTLLDGIKCGQLMYLYGRNPSDTEVTDIEPLKSSTGCLEMGVPINPDTLNQVWSINQTPMSKVTPVGSTMSTYTILTEPYTKRTDKWFILQRGLTTNANRRQEQMVGSIRNAAYQKMGVLVWFENGGMPYCRNGNIDDIRFADEYGNDKASRIVTFIHEGTARGYAIYNYD